jgi:phage terminase small subunit
MQRDAAEERRRTVKPKLQSAPKGLGKAGKALWERVVKDLAEYNPELEFDDRELLVLETASQTADTIAALDEAIDEDGHVIDGLHGPKVHPAVAERRLQHTALLKLLASIQRTETGLKTPAQVRGSNAVNTRWEMDRARKALRAV